MPLKRPTAWIAVLTLATLVFAGCDLFGSNDPESRVTTDVVVANSGNFSAQDGSLTLYSPLDSSATLNDINVAFINSLTLHNDRLYVVDNTSSDNAGRITIFTPNTLEPINQISNPRPPRSLAFPTENKGYVTNLSRFDDNFNPKPSTVSVVNLDSNEVTKRVDVGRSPRGIGIAVGKAFIANAADNTLSVLDVDTDTVLNTISPGCPRPKSVFVDEENEVVVVCQGSSEQSPEVLFLNPGSAEVSAEVVDSVGLGAPIGSANGTQSAYYSEEAEELYAVSGGAFGSGTGEIFRVDTDANALATTLQVPQNDGLIGISAVGYDDVNQDLYVTRLPVNDSGGPLYTANGTALVLDRMGNVVTRFKTGHSPGYVAFLRDRQ
ncbi:MAG: YncE family protein [Salinibacter sp.]